MYQKIMQRNGLSEFLHSEVACNSNCDFETKIFLLYSVFLRYLVAIQTKFSLLTAKNRQGIVPEGGEKYLKINLFPLLELTR